MIIRMLSFLKRHKPQDVFEIPEPEHKRTSPQGFLQC